MVTVKKDNRVLQVDVATKDIYLAEGYDVVELVNGSYEVVEQATGGRTYSVAEYNALKQENEALKTELATLQNQKKPADKKEKSDK